MRACVTKLVMIPGCFHFSSSVVFLFCFPFFFLDMCGGVSSCCLYGFLLVYKHTMLVLLVSLGVHVCACLCGVWLN